MAISVIITKVGKAFPLFITLTRLKYPSILPDIGDKLKVNYFLQGKFQMLESKLGNLENFQKVLIRKKFLRSVLYLERSNCIIS